MPSERLIFTDLSNNNNKYWNCDLDGTVITCSWGRVGDTTGQRKAFSYTDDDKALRGFNSKVNSKLNKGYTRQETISSERPISVAFIAKVQIEHDTKDSETSALIDFLVGRNIHNIEGTTNIRMEAGQLTTPLGPVTSEGLDKAQALLLGMAAPKADLGSLANEYLRIIPRDIGRRKIDPASLFGSSKHLEMEQATIDSLRAVVLDVQQKAVADTASVAPVFSAKLERIPKDHSSFDYINKKFTGSVNKNHQSSKLQMHKLWNVTISAHTEAFESKLGNIKKLWHGTKDANLLSILKNGYVIPKRNSGIQISGRMYGDGIYFSDQSTKSLNYTSGYWGGNSSQRCFMLFNEVAMGNEYLATRGLSGGCPKGYDSTFAKGGKSGVINNEMIVYRTSQVNPLYLCEFR